MDLFEEPAMTAQAIVRRSIEFVGVSLMSLVLACEQERSPAAPARGESAASPSSHEESLSEEAADPIYTTIDAPGATFTQSNDIGPSGDIVGRYTGSDGKNHGYLLHQGTFTTIDVGTTYTAALGINSHGDVVGQYQEAGGRYRGFLRRAGTVTSINVGAAGTNAFGINDRGDIVGTYCNPEGCPPTAYRADIGNHGFLLREGTFTAIDFPGAVVTHAFKINAAGEIVGRYRSADGNWHAFVLSDREFTSIDVPGAIQTAAFPPPVGINAAGDVVGSYCAAPPCPIRVSDSFANVHGFLERRKDRDEGGRFTTIDFPGASGSAAYSINARGDIVGAYVDASHRVHAFLRSSGHTPVPVTGTFNLTIEPVSVRQADGNTVTDFTFHEQLSGSIAGTRVGTGTLVVHPDGTLTVEDTARFTGTVAGIPGSVIAVVRGDGTFASLTATATIDGSSGTGGLRGLRGKVTVTGAATGPTTLTGSYVGQVRFQASDDDDVRSLRHAERLVGCGETTPNVASTAQEGGIP
jgi:uncharacterized membrane protein